MITRTSHPEYNTHANSDASEKPEIMNTEQVAEMLCTNVKWVQSHHKARKPLIPHYKLGRAVLYKRSDIEMFLQKMKVN